MKERVKQYYDEYVKKIKAQQFDKEAKSISDVVKYYKQIQSDIAYADYDIYNECDDVIKGIENNTITKKPEDVSKYCSTEMKKIAEIPTKLQTQHSKFILDNGLNIWYTDV